MQVLRKDSTRETELSGTAGDLLGAAQALRSSEATVRLDSSVDPSPYSRALSLLESRRTLGKVTISLPQDRDCLEIRGGAEELEILASNIEGLANEGDPAFHLHIEYFPDHVYLSEDSVPLVVTLQRD